MGPYRCRICDQVFDSIPEGSIPVGGGRRVYQLYRFPDNTVHDLRLLNLHKSLIKPVDASAFDHELVVPCN